MQDDVIVRGDGALLRALLVNALDNALKFSLEPVVLHIAAHEEQARIDVIDDGPGIAEEERARVFAPFYRAASARAAGARGHGIGLSLIARVAWAHGGTVELVERPVGTHLRILLPRWQAASARAELSRAAEAGP